MMADGFGLDYLGYHGVDLYFSTGDGYNWCVYDFQGYIRDDVVDYPDAMNRFSKFKFIKLDWDKFGEAMFGDLELAKEIEDAVERTWGKSIGQAIWE